MTKKNATVSKNDYMLHLDLRKLKFSIGGAINKAVDPMVTTSEIFVYMHKVFPSDKNYTI